MKWLVGLALVAAGWWIWANTGGTEPTPRPSPVSTNTRYAKPSPYGTPTSHPTERPYPTYTQSEFPTYAPQPVPRPTFSSETSDEPWNRPGPDLDCVDIGHSVRITGPDYHNLDRDGDGIGCESYGY